MGPESFFSSRRRALLAVPAAITAGALALGGFSHRSASAEGSEADNARLRCASRLSITLLGENASSALTSASNPLDSVDAMVETPAFSDRFSSFINAKFNGGPAETIDQEVIYYLSKYVIEKNKPWKELFVGHYDLTVATDKQSLTVVDNPNGLGYFRTLAWSRRYAGNEPEGIRIASAYRMISNTTGTLITASVGAPQDDRTLTGRQAGICKSCHFDEWYALDKAAGVLTKKLVAKSGEVTFTATTATGPQQFLGKTLTNDRELVETLVDSDAWKFGQCRNVFRYLFGREENTCEAGLFDKCVTALETTGTIKAAVAAVAKDPIFCL